MKKLFLFLLLMYSSMLSTWGQTWSAAGLGTDNTVYAFAVYNGELYAGGNFTIAGGNSASKIAKWDGSSWSAVGTGMSTGANHQVRALAVYNGELYAGGLFTSAGGVPVSNMAKWNGTSWSAVGTGTDAIVRALIVYNNELYAGGFFGTAGSITGVNRIAKWNGSAWSAVGSGVTFGTSNATVYSFTIHNGELYVGGTFSVAGGVPASAIAKITGSNWSAVGPGITSTTSPQVHALASYNGNLYAGGNFFSTTNSGTHITKWDGTNWSPVGGGIGGSAVFTLSVVNNELYAGGSFTAAGSVPAAYIASWNDLNWGALGTGLNDYPFASQEYNGELYVGGFFDTAGGVSAPHVARWTSCTTAPSQPGAITGNITPCSGNIETYSVAAVTGASSYTWTLPTGWTGTSSTNSISATVGAISGNITVTADNGCGSSPLQTLAVNVAVGPGATITASGSTNFCQGDSVVLTANTGTGYTYQWKLNNIDIPGATAGTYVATQPGSFTVAVSNGNCSAVSASTSVTVYPLPAPNVTQAGMVLSTTPGQGTYQWYKDGLPIPGATSNSYTVTQNGNYYVVVTSNSNCSAQSNSILITTVSLGSLPSECGIVIYPNPSDGLFTVEGQLSIRANSVAIEVTDYTGKNVGTFEVSVNNSRISKKLDIKTIGPGVYQLKLISGNSSSSVLPLIIY